MFTFPLSFTGSRTPINYEMMWQCEVGWTQLNRSINGGQIYVRKGANTDKFFKIMTDKKADILTGMLVVHEKQQLHYFTLWCL